MCLPVRNGVAKETLGARELIPDHCTAQFWWLVSKLAVILRKLPSLREVSAQGVRINSLQKNTLGTLLTSTLDLRKHLLVDGFLRSTFASCAWLLNLCMQREHEDTQTLVSKS